MRLEKTMGSFCMHTSLVVLQDQEKKYIVPPP